LKSASRQGSTLPSFTDKKFCLTKMQLFLQTCKEEESFVLRDPT
jgi:hypothetical protein